MPFIGHVCKEGGLKRGGSDEEKFMARDISVDKGSHILKIWKERIIMEIIQNV